MGTHALAPSAVPVDPPFLAVTVLTTLAHGGGLWLAIAAVLATRLGSARRAARHGLLAVARASAHLQTVPTEMAFRG